MSTAHDIPTLRVRDLGAAFDTYRGTVQVLDGVSFDIAPGEILGVVGESGSGKSTVARMIAGLTPPTAGRIVIDGIDGIDGIDRWADPQGAAALRLRFQMIFQDPYASLNPRWRVDRLIAEPLEVLGLTGSRAGTEERVADALRRVRMSPDDGRRYPHQFSGSASASPSRAPWPAGPSSSSATSPPPRSTSRCRPRCST